MYEIKPSAELVLHPHCIPAFAVVKRVLDSCSVVEIRIIDCMHEIAKLTVFLGDENEADKVLTEMHHDCEAILSDDAD